MNIAAMGNEITHIINKQVFELECPRQEHAFALRNKLSYDTQYRLQKIMERACDDATPGGLDFRIPLLEIDLGTLSFDQLEAELLAAFEKQFTTRLAHYLPTSIAGSLNTTTERKSLPEIWQYFLLTGTLPWFAGKQEEEYLSALFEEIISGYSDELLPVILNNMGNDRFIERLVAQASTAQLSRILQLLDIQEELVIQVEVMIKTIVDELLQVFRQQQRPLSPSPGLRETGEATAAGNEPGRLLIEFLQQHAGLYAGYLLKAAVESIVKSVAVNTGIPAYEQLLTQIKKIIATRFELSADRLPATIPVIPAYIPDLPEKLDTLRTVLESKMKNTAPGEGETGLPAYQKFYISNAGLILLANYLPVLFNELRLLEDAEFISGTRQVKAVFLLHYLCTGKEAVPEYILPLNKILCGLSLDEPLPSFYPLTEEEKNECDTLLNEVIVNWQRLGSTTVDGLREAFLQREGILIFEHQGWKLLVERQGHDVLLDAIPWSYRHTKLSWMQHLITTEW